MSSAGPGILWSVMPIELVLEGLAPSTPARAEMVVDGRILEVEPGSDGTATVQRLLSTDPRDYLDPRFQPGARVRV
ncbi:MAG: YlzJ-like family protein [Bacillota bacterium]